jgi:hypothetical protein
MAYTDSRCDLVEVREQWRVYVPSERSWDKAVRELEKAIRPERTIYYQPGTYTGKQGHQMTLMSWELTKGEDQLPFSYPDW